MYIESYSHIMSRQPFSSRYFFRDWRRSLPSDSDSSRTCSESLVFSLAILPERHVHVSKKSYIDFGDNFNFGELVFLASLIVGELVCRRVCCRRVGLSARWTVGELVCRRLGVSASWFVGELSIKRCSYL